MSFDDDQIFGVRVPHWRPDEVGVQGNFGDEIGPLLVRALRGDSASRGEGRLISVGSVMQFARAGDVVWGAGINGKVRQRMQYPLDVRSVRGPLTRSVLLGFGVPVPEIYGDPALLFPRIFPEIAPTGAGGLVVVPNLNEIDRVGGEEVLSPLGDAQDIAARIAGAEFVVASSLHALVLADAYGIPSRPLVPVAEHPFKYLDYYAGTGRADVSFATSVAEAIALGPVPPARVDIEQIADAFPHEMWTSPDSGAPVGSSSDFAELRLEGERQRSSLALAVGRECSDAAAQALVRAQHIIASQPRALTDLLEAAADPPDSGSLVALTLRFLRESEPRGDIDQRVARAVRRALLGVSLGEGADAVACRVAATGRLSLARKLASGEAAVAEGLSHLEQVEKPERAEMSLAPARGGATRRLLRGVRRWIRGS